MTSMRASSLGLLTAAFAVALSGGAGSSPAIAQVAPPAKVCAQKDRWFECAERVKAAIQATKDVNVALSASTEWAERYDALYRANARDTWTWSDQEMLNKAMEKVYDEALGQYLDPASLAFQQALKRYLPRLATVLELAGGAAVTGFIVLLAPAPTANDFTAAGPENKKINDLMLSKLPPTTVFTIKQRYPELFNKAMSDVKAQKQIKKP